MDQDNEYPLIKNFVRLLREHLDFLDEMKLAHNFEEWLQRQYAPDGEN
jgi:hypothetical protein